MSVNMDVQALLLFIVTCNRLAEALQSLCVTTCVPKSSDENIEGCALSTGVTATGCDNWWVKSNITNDTLGDIIMKPYTNSSVLEPPQAPGLYVTFTKIKFNYLQLQYKEMHQAVASCHVFNLSYPSAETLSHICLWPETAVGSPMELRYQAYSSKTTAVDEGHYIFRVPNPNRIDPENTAFEDWEFFLYVDVSGASHVTVRWPVPPSHFNIQYYIVKLTYLKGASHSKVIAMHRHAKSKAKTEESHVFSTESLSGRFYISVEIFHKNCSSLYCFTSKSPVFYLDNKLKSPLIIAAIGVIIMLPGFLYVFHSWRRFGALPPHKAPVVLLIYKRTMDSHFRVIVALVMYLRKFCHIRALVEDFDILSADTQDSSSWYRDAFSRVDAVMVVSSPHHMDNDKEKAYYNVNAAALHILEEKSNDPTCSLNFFSIILPYCTDKDIPKEAEHLPMFKLPREINAILWFIRFGCRTSWVSNFEFYLFQSQLNGGACDFARYGKFVRDTLVEANEESRRLGQ